MPLVSGGASTRQQPCCAGRGVFTVGAGAEVPPGATIKPMQAAAPPILRDLVLVGGGHSHVGVLRAFGMQPLAGLRITLVCTDAHTPYSGMLPGYVAGHYDFDAVHLDLVRLCVFAGARFVRAQVTGLDRERRQVLLADRPPLDYDLVSINTGSTPHTTHIAGADAHAVSVKPIAAFNQRWLT